jgi:hypothetical protein
VLAYEPPDRVVFSWDIDSKSQIETDLERTSEVEVRSSPMHPSGAPARAGGSVEPIVAGRREVHHLTPRAVAPSTSSVPRSAGLHDSGTVASSEYMSGSDGIPSGSR